MSPILVRPVREQLEHDRVIRLLQAKYKRKFEVAINPGNEQTTPVGTGPSAWYPDLVLQSADRHRKLAGLVEVETTESVNHLEAMSQWAAFARFRVPLHLYVPVGSVDTTRRFCTDLKIPAAEIWAYQAVGEQLRFTLVHRAAHTSAPKPARTPEPAEPAPRPTPAARRAANGGSRPAARTVRPAARPRANGQAAARTTRASAPGSTRRTPPKTKPAARRPAAKAAKAKPGASARAAKRR